MEIEVEADDTLGDLLRRAGEALARMGPYGEPPPWTPTYFGIYVEGQRTQLWNELTLLDADGRVRWNYRWQDETYGDLLRAIEGGALPGDPSRLYFVRTGGMGDGAVSSFPQFIELSAIWWEVLKTALDVAGVAGTVVWLIELAEAGEQATEVTDEKATDWKANGGEPFKIKELVCRKSGWTPADLGRLLNVTEADAKALLTSFGCTEGPDGRWYPGEDEMSKLMADNMNLVLTSPHIHRDAFRGEVRRRLDSFVETGKAPDPDYEVMAALPLDPHWSANQHADVPLEPESELAWWVGEGACLAAEAPPGLNMLSRWRGRPTTALTRLEALRVPLAISERVPITVPTNGGTCRLAGRLRSMPRR